MASLTQWTWVWGSSGKWWWTGRPGVLQSMGSLYFSPFFLLPRWVYLPPVLRHASPPRRQGSTGWLSSLPSSLVLTCPRLLSPLRANPGWTGRLSSGGSLVKNPPASAGDPRDSSLIPGLGRSPGEGNAYPLQYSCLENPIDREAWRATVHEVSRSRTWLSTHTHMHTPQDES